MSERRDPPRWLAAPPADLPAAVVEAARAYRTHAGPRAAQRAAVWQGLERELGAAVGMHTFQVPWLGLGAVLLLGVGAAWWAWPPARPEVPSRPPSAAAASPSATPASAELSPPAASAPSANAIAEPDSAAPARRRVAGARSAGSPPPSAAGSELELLVQARRLVRSSPQRALALAEQHRSRFPHGTFAEERELLAIEALQGLGLSAQAAARAQHFRQLFPTSAHARRVASFE